MSKKSKAAGLRVPDADWEPTVCFNFDGKNGKSPKNFDEITLDDTLKVTVVGKARSVSQSFGSKSFSITLDKIRIDIAGDKASSISDAMDNVQKGRRL